MTERTSVEHDGDRGSGEFTEDQWREFMMAVVSKTSRKIPVATVRGWVERMTEAFYDSVEALSSATALDLQEAAGVPHLVGKIIVQTAKDLNDLTEDEASKTSDAKVKVRTSQKKFGGSSGDVDGDEDDEEVTVSAKLDQAPAEGVGVSLEKVQMPIDDGSMDGSGVHHPDEASEDDIPEGDYEEQDEETAVFEDMDCEFEPMGSYLVEQLFEHSLDVSTQWYAKNIHYLLNEVVAIEDPRYVKQRFAKWKDTYDEVVLVSSIEDSDVIYSLQTLMRKFQPEMFRALAKARVG